ncbi:hypothetical protein GCM10010082_09160 [Kushneria pakistanensis]|uniref:Uncharacterized protein n=1 Tax=Kushneria pakistanensis TaxID=1508770 RepID=A0ABQ3FDL2_9GAMM|nr:hypothetical protein GCM10010082_09160 [Kushneria pakistanensis]
MKRLTSCLATKLAIKVKGVADLWPARITKKPAKIIVIKLNAAYAGGFALRHAGYGRADGGCDTTGTTACAALIVMARRNQPIVPISHCHVSVRVP